MIEYIVKGGLYIMVPLLVLSVIALAFIIERFWRYSRVPNSEQARKVLDEVSERLRTGEVDAAQAYCREHRSILTHVFTRVTDRFEFLVAEKRTIGEMRGELQRTAEENARAYLEEFVSVVYTVSTVAPLIGLLGTILGMIKSFGAISVAGTSDPQTVSRGISEALITTASGLIVAIPCVLSYNFFRRRIEKILAYLEPFHIIFINNLLRDLARFRSYKEMLKTAYRDGVLNEDEKAFLKQKRVELNISDDEGAALENEVRRESAD